MKLLVRMVVLLAVAVPTLMVATPARSAPLAARLTRPAVRAGQRLALTGTVAPGATVTVDWRRAGTWQRLTTVTARSGGYRVAVPTWWVGRRRLRVTVAASAVTLVETVTYDVAPRHRARGPRAFRRYAGERYWDPCRTITWKFNPAGGYAGSLATAKQAIAEVSQDTGLRFAYRGRSSRIAFRDGAVYSGANVLISWATPGQVPSLAGNVVGSGYSQMDWDGFYAHGDVVLDRTQHLRRGFHDAGPIDWGQVLLHELGHVVGLDHVASRSSVMFEHATARVHHYNAGDLRGLAAVGAGRRCG